MGDKTKISWADATVNTWRGCSKVSAGCRSCYAIGQVAGLARKMGGVNPTAAARFDGLVKDGNWTGVVRLDKEHLLQPLRWGRPRKIFINSLSDTFHENVPFEHIAALFGVMRAARHHRFLVLTKRPQRALEFFAWLDAQDPGNAGAQACSCSWHLTNIDETGFAEKYAPVGGYDTNSKTMWPLPNVHIGVSVEDQEACDVRVPLLIKIPAAVKFLSMEPLLSPVDLTASFCVQDKNGEYSDARLKPGGGCVIDQVIVGAESGPTFRPMNLDWARSIRDQCLEAGVAYFYKQSSGRKSGTDPHLDGLVYHQFPGDLAPPTPYTGVK